MSTLKMSHLNPFLRTRTTQIEMVLVGQAIRQGLRIAGRIDRKYNLNKLFVEKYVPPGYRKTVNRITDLALTASGGYSLYNIWDDLTNNAVPPKLQTSYRFRKTYSRNKFDYRRGYKYGSFRNNRRRRCIRPRYNKRSSYRR